MNEKKENIIEKGLIVAIIALIFIFIFGLISRYNDKSVVLPNSILQHQVDSLQKHNDTLNRVVKEKNKELNKLREDSTRLVQEKEEADAKYYTLSKTDRVRIIERYVGGDVHATDSTVILTYSQLDSINMIARNLDFCVSVLKNCSKTNEVLVEKNKLFLEMQFNDSLSLVKITEDRDYYKTELPKEVRKAKRKGFFKGLLIGVPAGMIATLVTIIKIK